MKGWTITRVWNIDGKLFVAPTIEQAIDLWRKFMDTNEQPVSIEGVSVYGGCSTNYNAIIKE